MEAQIVLVILSTAGAVSALLFAVKGLLDQVPDVIQSWHRVADEARRAYSDPRPAPEGRRPSPPTANQSRPRTGLRLPGEREAMTAQSWQLRRGDVLIGTLRLEDVDMFWTDCRFEPAPAWESVRPLFEASRDAWSRGDEVAALAADEAICEAEFVLVPGNGGTPLADFLLRISGKTARFRS